MKKNLQIREGKGKSVIFLLADAYSMILGSKILLNLERVKMVRQKEEKSHDIP